MDRFGRICVLGLIVVGSVLSAAAQATPKPVIVSVDAGGRFRLGEKLVTASRLGPALEAALKGQAAADRVVYLKARPNVSFTQILGVLRAGRKIKQDSFGLLLDEGAVRDTSAAVITKIVLEQPDPNNVKPNPLYLAVTFGRNGRLSLNGESHTPASLTKKLGEIFKDRAENGAFREGTNEVEQTVFLAPAATTTFGSIIQAARVIKDSGADPIGIELESSRPMEIKSIGK